VQNLFVPWNPDNGHMNWLFDQILPRIWNAGRTPLITWEPYTPGVQTASVDTQALVERNEYDAYIESLADTTPDDIEVRIKNGEYDGYIDRWADRLRKSLAESNGRQAYVRLAHEMNGDWYPWSPTVGSSSVESYVRMWQRVHDRFEQQGLGGDAVQWMWCVNATDVGSYSAEELYPGDGYVDWLGVDGYNWGASQDWSSWESPDSIYGGMLDRLRGLADKPVCVAEFASTSETASGYDPQQKDSWVHDTLTYFDDRGVDMWCWFNEDKETDWAIFNGVRGTETVTHNGEQVNAYKTYRETIGTDATATDATISESLTAERIDGD
jgi:beta-mannanase